MQSFANHKGRTINVAIDFDGTIDSFPREFQSLMSALCAAGHRVYIMTGTGTAGAGTGPVTQEDIDGKATILAALGITMYTALVVVPSPHDTNKAQLIQDYDIDLFIDNNKDNIKAAVEIGCASLLLFNSKI